MCQLCESTEEGKRLRSALDELTGDAHRQQEAADAARRAYLAYHDRQVLSQLRDAPGLIYVHVDPRDGDELDPHGLIPERHREQIAGGEALTPADFFDQEEGQP